MLKGHKILMLGFEQVKVDILHSAVSGNLVFNEWIDRLIDASGKEFKSFRVLGIFELEGEKIANWRDYLDASQAG
jgi:limonene-1,2-epoxide hydrolase